MRRSTSPRTSSTTAAASSKARAATTRRRARPASGSTRTCAACSTRPRSTGWSTPLDLAELARRRARDDPRQRAARPATSGRSSTAATTRSASTRCPARSTRRSSLWEWGAYLGQDALEQGVDVRVSSLGADGAEHASRRWRRRSANYANSALIKMEAIADGYSEGHRARHVRQRQRRQRPEPVHRPRRRHLHAAARPRRSCRGITRDSVITLARDLGFTVREEMLPREMLYIADEVFFVGTAAEVTPIRSVDKIADRHRPPRADHRGAPAARSSTSSTARSPDRHGWLTYVYPASRADAPPAAAGRR